MADFLIIGAGKSGTTSVFRYLSAHPQVFMPREKEVAFFSRDHLFCRGIDWYQQYFSEATRGQLCGEASPSYMYSTIAAQRIYQLLPNTKLIAILRNPIDRAFSHYRHACRVGHEKQTFSDQIHAMIEKRLAAKATADDAQPSSPAPNYVAGGEYGAVLSGYLRRFSHEQLKVIFFEDLIRQPEATTRGLYRWLGLSLDVSVPRTALRRRHNAGGVARYPRLMKAHIRATHCLSKQRWAHRAFYCLPNSVRSRLRAANNWMINDVYIDTCSDSGPSDNDRAALAEYYRGDVKLLEEICSLRSPWPEFNGALLSAAG